jgi:hypothetical protein
VQDERTYVTGGRVKLKVGDPARGVRGDIRHRRRVGELAALHVVKVPDRIPAEPKVAARARHRLVRGPPASVSAARDRHAAGVLALAAVVAGRARVHDLRQERAAGYETAP